jgi:hypothetical protein
MVFPHLTHNTLTNTYTNTHRDLVVARVVLVVVKEKLLVIFVSLWTGGSSKGECSETHVYVDVMCM